MHCCHVTACKTISMIPSSSYFMLWGTRLGSRPIQLALHCGWLHSTKQQSAQSAPPHGLSAPHWHRRWLCIGQICLLHCRQRHVYSCSRSARAAATGGVILASPTSAAPVTQPTGAAGCGWSHKLPGCGPASKPCSACAVLPVCI